MKFTVIGARGYIGSAVSRYLRDKGHNVSTPERGSRLEGNLGRVIYAAGATRDFFSDPSYTLRAHVTDFADLLGREFEHCWYLSSVRLYDFTGLGEVDETTAISINSDAPRSIYDATKACGESIAIHLGAGKVSVARLACVYGEDLTSLAFIHDLILKARAADTDSGSDENITRDYIHINDVCRALAHSTPPQGIINFSSGQNTPNKMIFKTIHEASGHCFSFRSTSSASPPRIRNEKFKNAFAFQPRCVLEWIVSELIEK